MALSQEEIATIVKLRGLGYTQQEIADYLEISKKTVQNHLSRIREQARLREDAEEEEQGIDLDDLFWGIVLGAGALALLGALLGNQDRGGRNR